jgi:hypothetical protein
MEPRFLCSVQWAALANEFKKIKRRLAEGYSMRGSVRRLAQTWPRLLAQPHVDVCVAQRLLGSRLRRLQLWVVVVQQPGQANTDKKAGEVTMTTTIEPLTTTPRKMGS